MRIAFHRALLFVGLAVCLAAPDVPAQQMSILNARLGVARAPRFKSDCWALLSVTLRNKGAAAVAEVQYSPLSAGLGRATTLFRKRMEVPSQAEIEFAFPVLTSLDEKYLIELFVNGVAVDKQQFSASMVNPADPFVLILDDGATGYSYLKDLRIENRKVMISIAQSGDLPGWWEILDSLNLIVVGDLDPLRVQQAQVEQLRTWIEGGGILVVSTDERWRRWQDSFLEDWLPVRPYGDRPIDAVPTLAERYGHPLTMQEDLRMCEAVAASGRVLVGLQGLPLLAYRKVGLGAVVFSAVRLDVASFARWSGSGALWEELFTLRERPLDIRRTQLEAKREEMLSHITGLPVPEPRFVARLLGAYLVLVVVLFLMFRFRRRHEWVWGSLLVAAPLTAGVYYGIGKANRQEFASTLNEIAVVRLSGVAEGGPEQKSRGLLEGFHSLYSAGETTYQLRAGAPDALLALGMGAADAVQATMPALQVAAEDVVVAEQVRVNEGGLRSFKSFATRSFRGTVRSSLSWGPGGVTGELRNELGFPLQDALVLFNRQIIPLRTLRAGESRRMEISDARNASYTPLDSLGGVALDVTRKRVLESLFTPLGSYQPAQDEPVLIGWGEEPVSPVADDTQQLGRKGLVLYLISLPCQRAAGDVLIPKGVCPVRVGSAISFRNGRWVQMQGFASGAEIELDFRLPPEVRDLAVEQLTARLLIENPGGDMSARLAAYDWAAGQWVEVGGQGEFSLPAAERFVSRPVGRVRLRLSVSALREKMPSGDTPSLRAFKWRVQDVDIEIRGKLS